MLEAILLPVAIVAGVGVLAGVILSLSSKFMSVSVDEKLESVRALLPGINCGACGKAGCDAYAKAIVAEGDKTNRCIPGGDTTSRKISEVLGIPFQDVQEQTAFVACKGNDDATTDKMIYDGIPTCYSASMFFGGNSSCSYGCLAYGDCAAACPYHAILIIKGVAVVDAGICVGCGLCVSKCPKHLISLHPQTGLVHVACSSRDTGAKTRRFCSNGCIGCKKCERICPAGAVTVTDNLAYVDSEKCTSCGQCIEVCPVHVITGVDFMQ